MAPKTAKFTIQPFKQHAPMDEEYVQKTWSTLRHAIGQIFAHDASGLSFEELYRRARASRALARATCAQCRWAARPFPPVRRRAYRDATWRGCAHAGRARAPRAA